MEQKVYINKLKNDARDKLQDALIWIGADSLIKPDAHVFIKPNFTFPFFKPGVTTSPEMIDALVSVLKTKTKNIIIGETDGGANSWKAEEAFEGHDVPRICRDHGIKMLNLSKSERKLMIFELNRKEIKIELPRILLEGIDVFITMPVPKIHCMTKVSLGLKNQWGCISSAEKRFRYHPYFDELVCYINKALRVNIVVGDATYMLTGNGPMFGEQIKMDMLVVSNDIGSFELAMLHLMQLESWNIGHIKMAQHMGIVPHSIDEITFNKDWDQFKSNKFFLKRTLQNYIALAGFKSRFITWFGYESVCAEPLHKVLYAIKGNPLREAMRDKNDR